MTDQNTKGQDPKRKNETDLVTEAVVQIAETEAGVIFFKWLKNQCHFDRSTISGNQTTYEVNTIGSVAQEFQRCLYLKIRRGFDRKAKIRIEIE